MKAMSIAELTALRDKMKDKVAMREGSGQIRVVVGMATCGIAAGARPVLMNYFTNAVNHCLGEKVIVSQTGCIGICQYEPVVEIFEDGKDKVTYVKMDAAKAAEVVEQHLKGGKVIDAYTIGQNK